MSSKQLTLADIGTETPDAPDDPRTPVVGGIPNFNRERGRERTELGAPLPDLCDRVSEQESARRRGARLAGDGAGGSHGDE